MHGSEIGPCARQSSTTPQMVFRLWRLYLRFLGGKPVGLPSAGKTLRESQLCPASQSGENCLRIMIAPNFRCEHFSVYQAPALLKSPEQSVDMRIPWPLKIAAKVVLSRLPFPYSFWRRLSLFKHGDMSR